jgi:hypothetical protein
MKKSSAAAVLVLLICLAGCSFENPQYRIVELVIPLHPWEEDRTSMWYSLVWNEGTGTKTLFVDNATRKVRLKIPRTQTTYICAYPLGNLKPFGTAVTPLSGSNVFALDQDKGVLAELLLGLEHPSALTVNFDRLVENASLELEDFSLLDPEILLEDVYNGNLSKKSIVRTEPVKVTGMEFYSGLWIPESIHQEAFSVEAGEAAPVMHLAQGVHRYYCRERSLEIRIVVSFDGVYRYERVSDMV